MKNPIQSNVNKRAQVFLFARIFYNITFTYKNDKLIMKIHFSFSTVSMGGSVAKCWIRAQMGLGSHRSRDAVLGKLFTPIVSLFAKQQNW